MLEKILSSTIIRLRPLYRSTIDGNEVKAKKKVYVEYMKTISFLGDFGVPQEVTINAIFENYESRAQMEWARFEE